MADNLRTFAASCLGGLVLNQDPLTQGGQMPGSALRLINYEPALNGGYRRISGYANTYGEVPGEANTPVLGVHVSADINDGIFAARKPAAGNNYLHKKTLSLVPVENRQYTCQFAPSNKVRQSHPRLFVQLKEHILGSLDRM